MLLVVITVNLRMSYLTHIDTIKIDNINAINIISTSSGQIIQGFWTLTYGQGDRPRLDW